MRNDILRSIRRGNSVSRSSIKLLTIVLGVFLLFGFLPVRAKPVERPAIPPPDDGFPPPQPPLAVIVPLYIYPKDSSDKDTWKPLVDAKDASPNLEVWAIIDPPMNTSACIPRPRHRACLSEPPPFETCTCSTLDPNYMGGLKLLKEHGIRMLGYVDTAYGLVRDCDFRECITRRIDTWKKLVIDYANTHGSDEAIIEGIFFDQMDNNDTSAVYHAMLSNYARDGNHPFKYTVGNPGNMPTQAVADSVTTIVIYENSGFPATCFLRGTASCAPNPLPAASSMGKFAILPHDVTSLPTPCELRDAGRFVRYIYVTDEVGSKWNEFPSYLKELFATLQGLNDGTIVCLSPITVPTLSAWGMIIMALLLLTVGVIFILRRRQDLAVAATGGVAQFNDEMNQTLFVPAVFGKALAGTLALSLAGFALVTWLSSSIRTADICGTLVCALILAYVIHLLILAVRDF